MHLSLQKCHSIIHMPFSIRFTYIESFCLKSKILNKTYIKLFEKLFYLLLKTILNFIPFYFIEPFLMGIEELQ